MVPLEKVELAERLLDEGASGRATAIRAVLCRGTVSRIKSGQWRRQYRNRIVRRMNHELKSNGRVMRCPDCGASVKMPCRACRVRGLLSAGRLDRRYRRHEIDELLAVEIRDPESRRRYGDLFRRKRRDYSGDGEAVWQPEDCFPRLAEDLEREPDEADLAAIDAELAESLSTIH